MASGPLLHEWKAMATFPHLEEHVTTVLIARELATRHALGFPINLPVMFRKSEHIIVALPSSRVATRQEFYHGLALDKIYVTTPQGKQRAKETMQSRAEAMKRANSRDALVYTVETVDTIRGGRLPLMDGHGNDMLTSGFDLIGKEFGHGTLRMHYWEKGTIPLK